MVSDSSIQLRAVLAVLHPPSAARIRATLAQHSTIVILAEHATLHAARVAAQRADLLLLCVVAHSPEGDTLLCDLAAAPCSFPPAAVLVGPPPRYATLLVGAQVGISGWLTDDSPPDEVLATLLAAAQGGYAVCPAISRTLAQQISRARVLLDPHKRSIVELVTAGRTNCEIGRALHIDAKTVQYHLKQIYKDTGTHNRFELTTFWLRSVWGSEDEARAVAQQLGSHHIRELSLSDMV